MRKPVLGLDFGTTNTAAAWCDAAGEVHLVPVRDGVFTLPSIVCYHGGGTIVGEPARQLLADDPRHTIFGVKRFLGRRFFSDYVGRHRGRFVFHLAEGPEGTTAAEVHGKVIPLEDVALSIVERMVELANIALGAPFEECVCSVPAHFSQRQRRIIASVVRRAGLKLKAMVNEPTAAALYYAKQKADDTKVLVYDLGGGTFDTTLLRVRKGLVEVLSTGGEAFLGGSDFDQRIADQLAERFEREHGVRLVENNVVMQRLAMAAEDAKIRLSSAEATRVRVPCVFVEDDRFLDLDYAMTRHELEQVCAPLIERTLGIALQTVGSAGMAAGDVDEVLLLGGQTKMPGLRARLKSLFKIDEKLRLDPELGVAVGAATLGRGLQVLVDVLSIPIGVMLPGAGPHEAIAKNTPLPCVKRVVVPRPELGRQLPMIIYEALEATSIDRDILGTLRVGPEWLADHPGDLTLELRLSSSFELAFLLRTAAGAEKRLSFADAEASGPTLRAPAAELPAAPSRLTDAAVVARLAGEPRVTAELAVSVRYGVESQAHGLRTGNLSRQGMFIKTPDPPPARTVVEVIVDVGGEPLILHGEVVHSLNPEAAASVGQEPGFGMRITSPPLDVERRLDELVRHVSEGKPIDELEHGALSGQEEPSSSPLDVLKRFMEGVGRSDYYGALGAEPLATSSEIKQKIGELKGLIERLLPKVTPSTQVKLKTASRILDRVAVVLYDPRKRLLYDFQKGLVLADERLGNPAESGIFDLGLLREAWRKVRPADADRAAVLLAHASRAEASGDLASALKQGREALALDPFDCELRARLKEWEARLSGAPVA